MSIKREALLIQDSNRMTLLIKQGHPLGLANPELESIINGKNNRERHIHHRAIKKPKGIKMKRLEELRFSHEPTKWRSPTFTENMNSFNINPRKLNLWQSKSFPFLQIPHGFLHHKIHQFPSIRLNQPTWNSQTLVHPYGFLGEKTKLYFVGWNQMGIQWFWGGLKRWVWWFCEEVGCHGRHWRWEEEGVTLGRRRDHVGVYKV